jgi:hypothetical protein
MENNLNLLKDLQLNPDNIKNYLPEKSWLAFKEWVKIINE